MKHARTFTSFAASIATLVAVFACSDSTAPARDIVAAPASAFAFQRNNNKPPVVSIAAPADSSTFAAGASVSFTGSATDPETGTLTGSSLKWTSDRDGQIGTGTSFSKSTLSSGTHTITLTATDWRGAHGSQARTITILTTAPANQAPTASISSPANNASFAQGTSITFTGSGTDSESGPLTSTALVWSSNINGQVGTGASLTTSGLSAGSHTITLTAKDPQNATGTATISITITASTTPNQAPSAAITTPTHLSTFGQGTSVSFTGWGNDPETGALTGTSLVWASSIDGQLATGTSFSKSNLSVGTHTVTLTARDAQGATGVSTHIITVSAATVTNQPPVAQFSVSCVLLVCSADASASTDDAGITQYVWNWGSGQTATVAVPLLSNTYLAAGTFTVTLTVRDVAGLSSSQSKSVTVAAAVQSPPPSGANEPSGMTALTDRPFDAINETGWDWYGVSQPTIVSDATAPKSSSSVARITYASGFTGGSGQGQVCKVGLGKKTLYMSAWIKLSPNFEGHPTGANKIFYIATNSDATFVLPEADGVGSNPLYPRFVLQNLAANYQDQGGVYATTVGRMQNVGSGTQIVRGQWHKYEYLLVNNTPGLADGSIDEWQDGVKTFSLPNLSFVPASATGSAATWGSVCWQPIWGGQGGTVVNTFYMELDHVYISGK
jgi:hypothetical protein